MSDMLWQSLGAKEPVTKEADHYVKAEQLKPGDKIAFGIQGVHPIKSIMKLPNGDIVIDGIMHTTASADFLLVTDPSRALVPRGAAKTATDWDQVDFDANRSYWSGRADAARQQQAAEQRMRDMKGQRITVTRGRKIPIGTTGTAFWVGPGQWGWRIGFKTDDGAELWTDVGNVELADASVTASKTAGSGPTPPRSSTRRELECPRCGASASGEVYTNTDGTKVLEAECDSFDCGWQGYKVMSASKTAMPNPVDLGIQVGDIFVDSWGYDQTNIDFYQVTGLTGASARLRPIAKTYTETGFMSGPSVPHPGQFTGGEITKRVYEWNGEPYVNSPSGFGSCSRWDGKPVRESHYA